MNENKKILQEGFRAFFSEAPCPYEKKTLKHTLWKQGWAIAFEAFFNIDEQGVPNKHHFYRDGSCIVELEEEGTNIDWVRENVFGPFKDYNAALEWAKEPGNLLSDRYRYKITLLNNPDE